MKIAVATDGCMVATHFGRCPEYTIFTIDNGTITDKVVISNPDTNLVFCQSTFLNSGSHA